MTDIESRLQNWARWAKVRPNYSSCRSLEGRYKAPPTWHPPEPKVNVDILDAVVIEKELTGITFPKKARELIKYSYLTPFINPMKICRKLAIRNGEIDTELRMAINMLENRLKVNENGAKKLLTAIKDKSINVNDNLTLSLT